jgi:hypothetical protein
MTAQPEITQRDLRNRSKEIMDADQDAALDHGLDCPYDQ